jgi:hypothetical protein
MIKQLLADAGVSLSALMMLTGVAQVVYRRTVAIGVVGVWHLPWNARHCQFQPGRAGPAQPVREFGLYSRWQRRVSAWMRSGTHYRAEQVEMRLAGVVEAVCRLNA